MKTKLSSRGFPLLFQCLAIRHETLAQGTTFTYQGRLTSGGTLASGSYDFQFILFDNDVGGNQQGVILTNTAIGVANGLFTTTLDFGAGPFSAGAPRWLEISVRTNNTGSFAALSPRQPLSPAPYAVTAGNVTGVIPGAGLAGTYTGAVTLNNAANSFSGSGAGLTTLNADNLAGGTVPDARLAGNVARTNQVWLLAGNSGTAPSIQFLGTADNQPLEFKVNNSRALRLEPVLTDANHSNIVNVIAGAAVNFVTPGVVGGTIAGGGASSYFGTASTNRVSGNFATVGGGSDNSSAGQYATVG